jgi:hypothetical protein
VSSDNENEVLAVPMLSQEDETVLHMSTARVVCREKCRKSLKLTSDEIVSLITRFCCCDSSRFDRKRLLRKLIPSFCVDLKRGGFNLD